MKTPPPTRAFSLVEVTIAIAVLSFCLLTLLALVPIGLTSTTDSLQKTNAAGIVSQIAADLRDTPPNTNSTIQKSPRFGLAMDGTAATGTTNTFYLDDTGNPTGAAGAAITPASIYKATVVIATQKVAATAAATASQAQNKPTAVWIIVSWPAHADATASALPVNYQSYYDAVTYIDRN